MLIKMEPGIHSFSLFGHIPYSNVQNVVELLLERGRCYEMKRDKWNINRTYFSNYYAKSGVLIYLYQHILGSGILLRVTPCTLLHNRYAATELYIPNRSNYFDLMYRMDHILDDMELDLSAHRMSISRADPCINIQLKDKDMVLEYIRILKKSCPLPHYGLVTYDESFKSVKNAKEANNHSYRIASKHTAFTAYDKTFVLHQLERCPDDLIGKCILRIEAELDRQALLKRIHYKKGWDNYRILKATAKSALKIIHKYLKRILCCSGDYVRYENAIRMIEQSKYKTKTKEQMKYLVLKASRSDSLGNAIQKLRKNFRMSKASCRELLKKFDKLGISPITLRNNSTFDMLPSLFTVISENKEENVKRDTDGFIILSRKDA